MKLHHNEKYFKWGLTAFLVFVACSVFWMAFSNIPGFYALILDFCNIISPILFGLLFAYLMNPVMLLARRVLTRLLARTKLREARAQAIVKVASLVIALLVFLLALFTLFTLIFPSLISSLEELLQQERLEAYYNKINSWLNNTLSGTRFEAWFHENLDDLLKIATDAIKKIDIPKLISNLTSSVYSVLMFLFNALLGIVAAVYLLIYKQQLCAQAKKITVAVFNERHADRLFEIARRTNRIFSGYVVGKIIDAIFVGVVTNIALLIMHMPYAPLIGVIVGVTNVIPFFGPYLGAIPSALLLLIENPLDALYFIIFIVVLQMIEGNIIENRILGEKLGISDFWVLVAILVFGGIFGFGGMLLGVPIFAVIYTLISDSVNGRLKRKRYPLDTALYYSLQCVSQLSQTPPSASSDAAEPDYELRTDEEQPQ